MTKVLLNDINIVEEDCLTARRANEVYTTLQQLNRRANEEYFTTRNILARRSTELENVEEILDFALMEDDVEAISFYQSRKAQLDIQVAELDAKMDEVRAKMKTEYVELTDEEFQVFTLVNDWSYLGGRNRTGFSK